MGASVVVWSNRGGVGGFLGGFLRESSVDVVHKGGLLIGASEAGAVAAWIEGVDGLLHKLYYGGFGDFFKGGVFRLTFLVKCDIIKGLTIGLGYGTLTYYSINLVVFALSI